MRKRVVHSRKRLLSIRAGRCFVKPCRNAIIRMTKEASEIALKGLRKFPDEDPVIYHNIGGVFFEMGWRSEAIEVLKKGIEKFPEDEDLKILLKEIEDDLDDFDSGGKTPLLGALLLMLSLFKRTRRR